MESFPTWLWYSECPVVGFLNSTRYNRVNWRILFATERLHHVHPFGTPFLSCSHVNIFGLWACISGGPRAVVSLPHRPLKPGFFFGICTLGRQIPANDPLTTPICVGEVKGFMRSNER